MRIGEIAALVGLTSRAIRHYHHVGLLPEPERRPNGFEHLDALAEAPADDPRIAPLPAGLVAAVPDELFAAIPEDGVVVTGYRQALLAEFAPAQAEVVSRLMDASVERGRG